MWMSAVSFTDICEFMTFCVAEYYCPATDSLGMRYILHTPLEMPHVTEFASSADLEKEILVEVHPDMTNADDDIREIDPVGRINYLFWFFYNLNQLVIIIKVGLFVAEKTRVLLWKREKTRIFWTLHEYIRSNSIMINT